MSEKLERLMYADVRHGLIEFHIVVEFHRRVEEGYDNRGKCHLLNGDFCSHDGTSLWASEAVMPAFETGGSGAVYSMLEYRYKTWSAE